MNTIYAARQVAVVTALAVLSIGLLGCPPRDRSVAVPNVVGATQSSAQNLLNAAGLNLGSVSEVYSETVPVGRIVSQSPAAGASVPEGTAVSIVISLGSNAQDDYDDGFAEGFANDDEYWQGFYDSWDTYEGGDIYYTGDLIPDVDDPAYDAGYWDGVWYAYHDGYFIGYDYAFTIGFSEGYDAAYASDYAAFLNEDEHIEWLDGGFSDGYNDGFSEGRVFGAYDYAEGIGFDWLDALLDYRSGTDITVAGVSTGSAGPVTLYEYGTNPFDLVKSKRAEKHARPVPSIRFGAVEGKQSDPPPLSYRPLPPDVQEELNVRPTTTERGGIDVSFTTTWLQRVSAYRSAIL
jgi:hypothetical protein